MEFCYKTAKVWQIVGYAFLILKIVIPLILIILGIIDLGKAVISSDDKAIKKSTVTLIKRVIAGIAIFFIPTIIQVLYTYIAGYTSDMNDDFMICIDCITSPNKDCDTSYKGGVFPTDNWQLFIAEYWLSAFYNVK